MLARMSSTILCETELHRPGYEVDDTVEANEARAKSGGIDLRTFTKLSEGASEYASLDLKHDARREDGHRTLMSCYARLGQRAQAMRQHLLCQRLLRETFHAVPEPATSQRQRCVARRICEP